MKAALLGLLVAFAASPAAATAKVSTPLVPRIQDTVPIGFNDPSWLMGSSPPPASEAELGAAYRDIGARIVRFGVDWKWVEPAPGAFDLGVYQRAYDRIRAQRLRPLVIVSGAPRWAAPAHAQAACDWRNNACRTYAGPAHLAQWGDFVARVVRAMPDAVGIEVLNEPNLPLFWDLTPGAVTNASTYVDLLRAAHAAVKRTDPHMPVVGGALANGGYSAGAGDLESFLNAILRAGGAGVMDALSLHPYPYDRDATGPDSGFTAALAGAHRALRAQGLDGRMRLWLTEVGLPTVASPFGDTDQARVLPDLLSAANAMRDVDVVIFHTLIDPCTDARDQECGFGLARPVRDASGGLVKRQAWGALRDRVALLRARGRCHARRTTAARRRCRARVERERRAVR